MMDFGMPFLLELNTLEDAAKLCHELRLAFVEINTNFPACQLHRLNADMLRALKEKYGIYFTLHIEEECDPFTFNPGVRAAWMQGVQSALRLAKEVNMPIVNMHLPRGVYITLPTEKVFLYEKYADEFRTAQEEFIALCEREMAGSGITVCIENTSGWKPHERGALDRFLASPVFGLTLDIGHSHAVGNVDEDYILANRDRLRHMHGHDALGRKNHLALGDGEIDLAGRFALANACGARVVLETKTIQALHMSVQRLNDYL